MRHAYADSLFQDCPDQNIDAMWDAYADSCRIEELESQNAKLRELVRDVYTLHWNGLDCTECPWFDECDTTGGCPWLSIFADHMRELGIEVDA